MTTGDGVRLRVGTILVELAGPPPLVARALGPLRALELEAPFDGVAITTVQRVHLVETTAVPPPRSPRTTRYVAGPPERIETDGVGVATLPPEGGPDEPTEGRTLEVALAPNLPDNDLAAERLLIPALAEVLRRRGAYLLHAACVRPPGRDGVWLVPAARGSGKTTLSLMLRRAGHALLSDDRVFLLGDDARLVDPWPEAPRVGDRSLYLLPPDVAPGRRDPVLGKAPVPALTPPRLDAPLRVLGVLLPRLVDGPGGDVRDVGGAAALAAVATQSVVATTPSASGATLRAVAALLASVPCRSVAVGVEPSAIDPTADA